MILPAAVRVGPKRLAWSATPLADLCHNIDFPNGGQTVLGTLGLILEKWPTEFARSSTSVFGPSVDIGRTRSGLLSRAEQTRFVGCKHYGS